MNTKEIYSDKN